MNYARGRQVTLHDPRLGPPRSGNAGPPNEEDWSLNASAIAPKAWCNLEVDPKKDKVVHLFTRVAMYGNASRMQGVAELDALHIFAHGNRGWIEIGVDGLSRSTMEALRKITGMFRYIIIHSCLTGKPPVGSQAIMAANSFSGSQFARKAAEITKASVVVARENQTYGVRRIPGEKLGGNVLLDFGDWDGPVDVYQDGVAARTYNNSTLEAPFDLETLIFGAAKKV